MSNLYILLILNFFNYFILQGRIRQRENLENFEIF